MKKQYRIVIAYTTDVENSKGNIALFYSGVTRTKKEAKAIINENIAKLMQENFPDVEYKCVSDGYVYNIIAADGYKSYKHPYAAYIIGEIKQYGGRYGQHFYESKAYIRVGHSRMYAHKCGPTHEKDIIKILEYNKENFDDMFISILDSIDEFLYAEKPLYKWFKAPYILESDNITPRITTNDGGSTEYRICYISYPDIDGEIVRIDNLSDKCDTLDEAIDVAEKCWLQAYRSWTSHYIVGQWVFNGDNTASIMITDLNNNPVLELQINSIYYGPIYAEYRDLEIAEMPGGFLAVRLKTKSTYLCYPKETFNECFLIIDHLYLYNKMKNK